ncbi:hypothetical protein N431DRAFT_215990 [Stipitochalara longipes BDJ]|nr:hypothetical protein N431DRAFT_215990 [Stipitochalara longipes BDJ]
MSQGGVVGDALHCFGAVRLLKNPPFSIEIGQLGSPLRHCVCGLSIVDFPFSCKFRLAAYTGSKYYSLGSGLIAETCLAFFAYQARVPEK